MDILFVCTGNICRSPMAEALFREHAARHDLPCTVRSAGLVTRGEAAASGAVAAMATRGLDLSNHRSRVLDASMIDRADLVLAMERRHVRAAVARAPSAFPRVYAVADLVARGRRRGGPAEDDRIGDWLARMHDGRSLRAEFADDPAGEVPDPLGSGAEAFERTARRLDALISALIGLMATIEVRPLPVGDLVVDRG